MKLIRYQLYLVYLSWIAPFSAHAQLHTEEIDGVISSPQHWLIFAGPAEGGSLMLGEAPAHRFPKLLKVGTTDGEPPEQVAWKFTATAARGESIGASFPGEYKDSSSGLKIFLVFPEEESGPARTPPCIPAPYRDKAAAGLLLHGLPDHGRFFLTGTETGLGIPDPPLFLSAKVEPGTGGVLLAWRNPEFCYDAIGVAKQGGISGRFESIEGTSGSLRLTKQPPVDSSAGVITVVGYVDNIPSPPAFIRVAAASQMDDVEVPFRCGIMPNWTPWKAGVDSSSVNLWEATGQPVIHREDPPSRILGETDNAGYFQSVSISGSGAQGGIYRKFLGLTSGNAYRVRARLNTC